MSQPAPKHVISLDVKAFVVLIASLLGLGVGGTSLVQKERQEPATCEPFVAAAKELSTAVQALTVQVAVLAQKQATDSQRIDKLEAKR